MYKEYIQVIQDQYSEQKTKGYISSIQVLASEKDTINYQSSEETSDTKYQDDLTIEQMRKGPLNIEQLQKYEYRNSRIIKFDSTVHTQKLGNIQAATLISRPKHIAPLIEREYLMEGDPVTQEAIDTLCMDEGVHQFIIDAISKKELCALRSTYANPRRIHVHVSKGVHNEFDIGMYNSFLYYMLDIDTIRCYEIQEYCSELKETIYEINEPISNIAYTNQYTHMMIICSVLQGKYNKDEVNGIINQLIASLSESSKLLKSLVFPYMIEHPQVKDIKNIHLGRGLQHMLGYQMNISGEATIATIPIFLKVPDCKTGLLLRTGLIAKRSLIVNKQIATNFQTKAILPVRIITIHEYEDFAEYIVPEVMRRNIEQRSRSFASRQFSWHQGAQKLTFKTYISKQIRPTAPKQEDDIKCPKEQEALMTMMTASSLCKEREDTVKDDIVQKQITTELPSCQSTTELLQHQTVTEACSSSISGTLSWIANKVYDTCYKVYDGFHGYDKNK